MILRFLKIAFCAFLFDIENHFWMLSEYSPNIALHMLQDERITRTVARTFAPDFNFYMDFPTPLLWTEAGSDALSLAEILETAEATFELWHQAPSMPQTGIRGFESN